MPLICLHKCVNDTAFQLATVGRIVGGNCVLQSPEFVRTLHHIFQMRFVMIASTILSTMLLVSSPAQSNLAEPFAMKPRLELVQQRRYIRGPRGGCYYINRNGNRTYVDRSLCGRN